MRRPGKPLKPLLLADAVETDSIAVCCENRGECPKARRAESALQEMAAGSWQIEAYLQSGALNTRPSVLAHNRRMQELREIIRFELGARYCFKCGRLFHDPDLSHRGCTPCYMAMLLSKPPQSRTFADEREEDWDRGESNELSF